VIGSVFIVAARCCSPRSREHTDVQPMLFMLVLGAGVGLCIADADPAAQNAWTSGTWASPRPSATFFRPDRRTLGVAVFLSILFNAVGGKIATAVGSALRGGPFTQALADPNVTHNPVNAPVLSILKGSGTGSLLQTRRSCSGSTPGWRRRS